jgi:predicted AAA+ superfamily ATPase
LLDQSKGEHQEIWKRLEKFSGFPEPYMTAQAASYLRWSTTFSQQLIKEDIRDLTGIKSLGDLETLYYMLPSKVGSPLSIPSLSSDLKTAYNTIAGWLETFERFFLIFSLTPWTRNIARAIQKERKIYLWDSPRVRDPSARLENMVALELYRTVTLWNDLGRGSFRLHFIKNKDQQEVDFLIAEDNRPLILIEVKLSETQPSAALLKFQSALQIPAVQLTNRQGGFRLISNDDQRVLVAPAWQWIATLPQQKA